jgi:hypothetical protein
LFPVFLIVLTGCSEFIKSDERTTSTSIDVVGEPADPAADSMRQADILGSADDSDSVANAKSEPDKIIRSAQPESADSESEPDVAGGLGLARPVSLKTKKPEVPSGKKTNP